MIPAENAAIVWRLVKLAKDDYKADELLGIYRTSREAVGRMNKLLVESGRISCRDDIPDVDGCNGFGQDEFMVSRMFMKPSDAEEYFAQASVGGTGMQI